jgi:Mg2+/Co2+ transporter CorB
MFSGLNLAFFSISRLRLEVEKGQGNTAAAKVLLMREDGNFLLTTILWGNVGINVLLTLLSSQVLAGVAAFLFSTVFITIMGEIVPQAYFSRHALKTAALLSPVLRIYQVLLYPFAKPTALLLDVWLGREGIHFYKERELKEMIELHVKHEASEIDAVEGTGALNFLNLDDMAITEEGESVDPKSIISLPFSGDTPHFPHFYSDSKDPFLRIIHKSRKKWIILTDQNDTPHYALDADNFLREVFFTGEPLNPLHFCHRPIIITDPKTPLDHVIPRLKVTPQRSGDDVIDEDLILLWADVRQVITGADILGRLLRGISTKAHTMNALDIEPKIEAPSTRTNAEA